jgi:translation initiation factor IF-2
MSKIRVYQLAKELELSSKDMVQKLNDLGIEVTNHMSAITDEEYELIQSELMSDDVKIEKVEEVVVEEEVVQPKGKQKKKKKKKEKKEKKSKGKKSIRQMVFEDTTEDVNEAGEILIDETIALNDFASKINKSPNELIMKLMGYGIMATINQEIDYDTCEILAAEYSLNIAKREEVDETEFIENLIHEEADRPEDLVKRAPVVTVMGHVDHGKTSLLDAIRNTEVTTGEAGGITQHIGASEVVINDEKIVFLDTPGHEAFTTLRARGAKVTDIAILVVAADDGVMPQTIEAIDHAKAAGVPIIVAVNKIDKVNANPERVKQELAERGLLIEEWGGDVVCCHVSALKGEGIDHLLEMVILVSEMLELKANPDKHGTGTIIEAQVEKGRGPVATIIVQEGTLTVGDPIVVGSTHGKIRAMFDYRGRKVKVAGPSTSVEITGLNDVAQAGDKFFAVDDEKTARLIAEKRITETREKTMGSNQHVTLEDLFKRIQDGEIKDLNIIVKADAHGSVEALKQSLIKLSNDEVRINVIHGNVGTITESDILLASASNAIIIGFNVRPNPAVVSLADKENVDLKTYRIIYEAINDVEQAMIGMLDPEYKEVVLGQAEVRLPFKVPNVGVIAGSYVTNGKITRQAEVRLVREGIVIHEGKISSLKRFKDDAKEVAQGYECGIGIENYNDLKEGDIIEAFIIEEIKRTK